jgi:hypothetical protein
MLTCCILLFFVPSTPPWGKGHPQHHQQLRTQPEVVATTESVDGTETVDPSRDLPLGLESVGQLHVEQTNVQRGVYGMPSRSSSHFVLEGPVIGSLNWEVSKRGFDGGNWLTRQHVSSCGPCHFDSAVVTRQY